jgi:hypothetical protein
LKIHPPDGPSNEPLLEALAKRPINLSGHVLVRSDGRVIPVEETTLEDWKDLQAQDHFRAHLEGLAPWN